MNCREFQQELLDLAAGQPAAGEAQLHLASCAACAAELSSFRQTMAVLDEWTAPADTSPYFMTRLRARLREEQEHAPAGWLSWFRRPTLAVAITTLLVVISIGLFEEGTSTLRTSGPAQTVNAAMSRPGTAVGDLNYLDKNHDLFADFDVLDDIDTPPTSN